MIFLYVNLVSWNFASEIPDSVNVKFHCDSISLSIAARLMGFKLKRSAGVREFQSREQSQNSLFLSSTKLKMDNEVVLPLWDEIYDIQLYEELIEKLKEVTEVYIGISSPKQDKLAIIIQDKFPCMDIYCFGAALSTPNYFVVLDKLYLTWLGFMLTNPRRFYTKICATLKQIFLLINRSSYRTKFNNFLCRM